MNKCLYQLVGVGMVGIAWGLGAEPVSHVPALPALPTPPQQGAAWEMPAGVRDPDGKIKAAVETLFGLGLGDPRGCEYRHVAVREGGKMLEARGWVLPAAAKKADGADGSLRFAIGWNGLIYPIEKVGEAADLAADLAILKQRGAFEKAPFSNYQEETLDKVLAEFAATPRMMRAWAAPYLLLRLGQAVEFHEDPAEPADPFATPEDVPVAGKGLSFSASLYGDSGSLLVEYARLLRGDGVAAFVEKNDLLAAWRGQDLDWVWAEVVRRMPHEQGDNDADPFACRPKLNSSWRSLLADAQRRLAPVPAPGPSELARTLAAWDQLEAWDDDASPAEFERVVAAGPAAIEPLLDCLDNDRRWTRASCGDGRSYGDGRSRSHLLPVRELAIFALTRILRFPVREIPDSYVPIEDAWYVDAAAKMRAFCRKYDNACGGELWFRILADENADVGDQLIAAKSLVRPGGTENRPVCDFFYAAEALERCSDPKASAEALTLRGRHDPTVLDLLNRAWRRARLEAEEQLAKGADEATFPSCCGGEKYSFPRGVPHEFVRLMEEWHPGNVDVLKEHYAWLAAALVRLRAGDSSGAYTISRLCEETLIRRFWAGDDTAMQDYEKFFRAALEAGEVPTEVMNAMPEEPGMDQLAQAAFLGDKAPLSLTNKPWTWSDMRKYLIEPVTGRSPLLVLPSFRRAVIEALKTQAKQGKLVVTNDGATLTYDSGDEQFRDSTLGKDAALLGTQAPGTTTEVRLCDLIAYFLTPKCGPEVWVSPAYHLDDALASRDRAIAEWIKVLSASRP